MGTMPGKVAHTPVFEGFDKAITADPQGFLKSYQDATTLGELLDDAVQKNVITPAVRQHIDKDWIQGDLFDAPLQGADAILMRGLLWAARLALHDEGDVDGPVLSSTRAVHTLWVCAFKKKSGRLEVVCTTSPRQVTVLLLTPMPVNAPDSSEQGFQTVWTTRHEDVGVEVGEVLVEKEPPVVVVRPTW